MVRCPATPTPLSPLRAGDSTLGVGDQGTGDLRRSLGRADRHLRMSGELSSPTEHRLQRQGPARPPSQARCIDGRATQGGVVERIGKAEFGRKNRDPAVGVAARSAVPQPGGDGHSAERHSGLAGLGPIFARVSHVNCGCLALVACTRRPRTPPRSSTMSTSPRFSGSRCLPTQATQRTRTRPSTPTTPRRARRCLRLCPSVSLVPPAR